MSWRKMNWIEPDWPVDASVHAATTLTTGGVSQPPFTSLNSALHVGDNQTQVLKNRQIIKNMLQLPAEPCWLQQVHGNKIVCADNHHAVPVADGSFSEQPGVVCVVQTADCLPVLMASADGQKIAAIHAGWRGLLAGILNKACDIMTDKHCAVWLGPAIGPECFEVGEEVRQAFVQKSVEFSPAFKQKSESKWLADIYQLARISLAQSDVENIYGGQFCTVTDASRFYSYRRDGQTGRMATLIWRD